MLSNTLLKAACLHVLKRLELPRARNAGNVSPPGRSRWSVVAGANTKQLQQTYSYRECKKAVTPICNVNSKKTTHRLRECLLQRGQQVRGLGHEEALTTKRLHNLASNNKFMQLQSQYQLH